MKHLTILAVALTFAFASCKKECGYITVKGGSEKRVFRYNDSIITGNAHTEYRLEFSDTKVYYYPDYPIIISKSDTADIKDCGEVTL